MKTVILYYSLGGKTEIVAQTLSHVLKADILRIQDIKKRDGFANKFTSAINALRETKTEIYPDNIDLREYSTVYIGTPVWSNRPSPAIITLIDKLNLIGKDVFLFSIMDSTGGKNSNERMKQKVTTRGGRVIETFTLKTKNKNEEQIINDTNLIIELLDLKFIK